MLSNVSLGGYGERFGAFLTFDLFSRRLRNLKHDLASDERDGEPVGDDDGLGLQFHAFEDSLLWSRASP